MERKKKRYRVFYIIFRREVGQTQQKLSYDGGKISMKLIKQCCTRGAQGISQTHRLCMQVLGTNDHSPVS